MGRRSSDCEQQGLKVVGHRGKMRKLVQIMELALFWQAEATRCQTVVTGVASGLVSRTLKILKISFEYSLRVLLTKGQIFAEGLFRQRVDRKGLELRKSLSPKPFTSNRKKRALP